jgi:hypothetical protein
MRGFESANKVPFKRSILWRKFDAILPDNAAGFVMRPRQPSEFPRKAIRKTCLIAMSHFVYAYSGSANLAAIGYYSYR